MSAAPAAPGRRPAITLVAAVATNGVIGRGNALCWHIPDDLRHFRAITMGHPVVMGRRTFESIGRPLPGRHNIVLTRTMGWQAGGVTAAATLAEALAAAGPSGPVMVIGGAAVFAEALPIADRIELTEVALTPEGDVHMPPIDRTRWTETARIDVPARPDRPGFSFVTLARVGGLAADDAS